MIKKCVGILKTRLLPFLENTTFCKASQLTRIGLNQHFKQGQYLLSKYGEKSYELRSTSYSRTILSLLSLLSGLSYNFTLPIRPIHASSLLPNNDQKCPNRDFYNKLIPNRNNWGDSITLRKRLKNKFGEDHILPLFEILTQKECSGNLSDISEKNISDFVYLYEKNYRKRWNDINFQKNSFLTIYSFLVNIFYNLETFEIYAGHDMNIEAILGGLGFPIFSKIPFASRIVFEIWKSNEVYFIKFLYNGELLATFRDGLEIVENRLKFLFPNITSFQDACNEKILF